MTAVVLNYTNASPLWNYLKKFIFYVGDLENVYSKEEIENFEDFIEKLFSDHLIIYLAQDDDWEGIIIINQNGDLLNPMFLKIMLEVAEYDLELLNNKLEEIRKFISEPEIETIIFGEMAKEDENYIKQQLRKILKTNC